MRTGEDEVEDEEVNTGSVVINEDYVEGEEVVNWLEDEEEGDWDNDETDEVDEGEDGEQSAPGEAMTVADMFNIVKQKGEQTQLLSDRISKLAEGMQRIQQRQQQFQELQLLQQNISQQQQTATQQKTTTLQQQKSGRGWWAAFVFIPLLLAILGILFVWKKKNQYSYSFHPS